MGEEMVKLENKVIEILKTIYDPEIPVDVFELGLIYEVKIDLEMNVEIQMTLTSPNCPVAESRVAFLLCLHQILKVEFQ